MALRLDDDHKKHDSLSGSYQDFPSFNCSQLRIQQHRRSKTSFRTLGKSRIETSNSRTHNIKLPIRMIVLISIMPWLYTSLRTSNVTPSRYPSLSTYPLLSMSRAAMVLASTTTISAFLHPLRKRTPLDGAPKRILTLPSLTTDHNSNSNSNDNDVGGYDPSEGITVSERIKERSNVGNPQQVQTAEKEFSVTSILKELAAIQQQGPQKYCILGTRHCSYLHQQIIELLAYALVLSGNHVYTSGSSGTNAATIRGALRAERPDLLTVVLPQSLMKQTEESQQLLKQVKDVIEMPQNNDLSLDIASRICNSYLLSLTDQLISFAFHESTTVIEAAKEAKELDKLVTVLFLD